VTISDGTGQIDIGPLFPSIIDKLPDSHKLKVNGTRLNIKGTIDQFRGDLQVQPGSAANLTIIVPKKNN